jgi:hypothetical protein
MATTTTTAPRYIEEHDHHGELRDEGLLGISAEYDNEHDLLDAVKAVQAAGYRKYEAFSPFPVHGITDVMEFNDPKLPWLAFLGGIAGVCIGFGFQTYLATIDYPMNVGGKPLIAWPQFIPVAYEATILFAGLTTFISMWALNGLPKPYQSIFNAQNFSRASQDRFFLCIEATDPKFDERETATFLKTTSTLNVAEVEK